MSSPTRDIEDSVMAVRRFLPNKSRFGIDRALQIVVRSAERHVVTYRRLLEHSGVSADSIRGVADLPLLPVLSKVAIFRDAPLEESIHNRASISKCVRAGTSGSTGLPVNIYMSRAEAWFRSVQLAAAWRRLARFPPVFRVADVGSWVANDAGVEFVRRGSVSVLRVSIGLPLARQADLVGGTGRTSSPGIRPRWASSPNTTRERARSSFRSSPREARCSIRRLGR